MNTDLNLPTGLAQKATLLPHSNRQKKAAPASDSRQNTWFKSYNDEWAAFVRERACTPKIFTDSEPLPRVWNNPHF
jgi:hypothetical protein